MKSGDIILLTRRKLSINPRSWLTYLISILSGKYVHTALIFADPMTKILKVREMDSKGVVLSDYSMYLQQLKQRITIITPVLQLSQTELNDYNYICRYDNSKYDFINLLFLQVLKIFLHRFVGRDTKLKRTCSEDTARIYNFIRKNTFENPKGITPNEVFYNNNFEIVSRETY